MILLRIKCFGLFSVHTRRSCYFFHWETHGDSKADSFRDDVNTWMLNVFELFFIFLCYINWLWVDVKHMQSGCNWVFSPRVITASETNFLTQQPRGLLDEKVHQPRLLFFFFLIIIPENCHRGTWGPVAQESEIFCWKLAGRRIF